MVMNHEYCTFDLKLIHSTVVYSKKLRATCETQIHLSVIYQMGADY